MFLKIFTDLVSFGLCGFFEFKLCLAGIKVVGANSTTCVAAIFSCSLPLIAVAIII